jgi:radical SAM superfamily enzyme with C-terminal helix-hairpin-helix motif
MTYSVSIPTVLLAVFTQICLAFIVWYINKITINYIIIKYMNQIIENFDKLCERAYSNLFENVVMPDELIENEPTEMEEVERVHLFLENLDALMGPVMKMALHKIYSVRGVSACAIMKFNSMYTYSGGTVSE